MKNIINSFMTLNICNSILLTALSLLVSNAYASHDLISKIGSDNGRGYALLPKIEHSKLKDAKDTLIFLGINYTAIDSGIGVSVCNYNKIVLKFIALDIYTPAQKEALLFEGFDNYYYNKRKELLAEKAIELHLLSQPGNFDISVHVNYSFKTPIVYIVFHRDAVFYQARINNIYRIITQYTDNLTPILYILPNQYSLSMMIKKDLHGKKFVPLESPSKIHRKKVEEILNIYNYNYKIKNNKIFIKNCQYNEIIQKLIALKLIDPYFIMTGKSVIDSSYFAKKREQLELEEIVINEILKLKKVLSVDVNILYSNQGNTGAVIKINLIKLMDDLAIDALKKKIIQRVSKIFKEKGLNIKEFFFYYKLDNFFSFKAKRKFLSSTSAVINIIPGEKAINHKVK